MTNECLQVQVSALVTFDLDSYLKLLFAFSVHGILIYLELSLGSHIALTALGGLTQRPMFIKVCARDSVKQ